MLKFVRRHWWFDLAKHWYILHLVIYRWNFVVRIIVFNIHLINIIRWLGPYFGRRCPKAQIVSSLWCLKRISDKGELKKVSWYKGIRYLIWFPWLRFSFLKELKQGLSLWPFQLCWGLQMECHLTDEYDQLSNVKLVKIREIKILPGGEKPDLYFSTASRES